MENIEKSTEGAIQLENLRYLKNRTIKGGGGGGRGSVGVDLWGWIWGAILPHL